MIRISAKHAALCLSFVLVFTSSAFAQKYEIHPLVGRNMPLKWADLYTLKSTSIIGVKGLVHANSDTQIEGEFEYLPHFEFRGTDPKIRAFVWGANVSRSFTIPNSKLIPFYTFGLGAVTANTDPDSVTMVLPDRDVKIDSGDTFFSMNYGVGLKAPNVFGKIGLRANVYGRTMPNFFGRANSWAEVTGGLIIPIGTR